MAANANYVSVTDWMVGKNLLHEGYTKEDVKPALAWFKRNLNTLQVLSPKSGVYLVKESEANAVLDAYISLVPSVAKIKQRACLKLCAKNAGMLIMIRAGKMPKKPTQQARDAFWETELGQALFEYQIIRLYGKKQDLIPEGFDMTPPILPPEILEVMKESEFINPKQYSPLATVKKQSTRAAKLNSSKIISKADSRDSAAHKAKVQLEPGEDDGEAKSPEETPPVRPPAASRKGRASNE